MVGSSKTRIVSIASVTALLFVLAVLLSTIINENENPKLKNNNQPSTTKTTTTTRKLRVMAEYEAYRDPNSVQIKVDSCPNTSKLHISDERKKVTNTKYFIREYENIHEYKHLETLKDIKNYYKLPILRTLTDNPYFACWDKSTEEKLTPGTMMMHYASAWNDNGDVVTGKIRDIPSSINQGSYWIPPKEYNKAQVIALRGDYIAYLSVFPGNYGHFLHDHLPHLSYFRLYEKPTTKFLLLHNEMMVNHLKFIDPTFEKRVVWIQPNQVFQIIDGRLMVDDTYVPPGRVPSMIPMLRRWMYETQDLRPKPISSSALPSSGEEPPTTTSEGKNIVFYSRLGSGDVKHGRIMEPQHEQEIIQLIRDNMLKYNRPEKLVIFNGQDDKGSTLPIEDQYMIFNAATTVIGPHGSGIANILWMDPKPNVDSCKDRPKVLEFLVNKALSNVQDGHVGRTYYHLFSFPSWFEYHHIFYTQESTNDRMFVHLNDVQLALDDMWGHR